METPWGNNSALRRFFSGRHGRNLREYLAAYALITPALLLIFTFGIFPVAFALYVSLHGGRAIRNITRPRTLNPLRTYSGGWPSANLSSLAR